jgi:uncharacterized protein (DUF362 family)/ferredoxin
MFRTSIVKSKDPEELLERTIELHWGLSELFPERNQKILIKPNLGCHRRSTTGATTDLRTLSHLIRMLQEEGYSDIVVGEGAMVGYIKIGILDFLGVRELCKKLGVQLIDLNKDKSIPMKLETNKSIRISRTVLESKVINLAKLKTHVLTKVTLGIKNLMGCVVGFDKREVHLANLDRGLASLIKIIQPDFTIIEGIIAMEGRGPVAGTPVESNLMIASKNVLAADIIGSRIMDFDPMRIRHIQYAISMGIGPRRIDEIDVVGSTLGKEVMSFRKPTSRNLETNPIINRMKHIIRGSILYDPACIVLSTKAGSYIPKKLGLIQDEKDYKIDFRFPRVDPKSCVICGTCSNTCPSDSISIKENKAFIDEATCIKCLCCVEICPKGAIFLK